MISIVICSIDPKKFSAIERHYAAVMGDEPFEIVGIHDATGLCEGYNRGLEKSKGDVVAFSHDDIEFLGDRVPERIKAHLAGHDVVGVAGTDRLAGGTWQNAGPPHLFGQVLHKVENGYGVTIWGVHRPVIGHMQALDGLFLAFRRPVIEQVRWDAETFTGFHHYDMDCTFRAYRMGFNIAVAGDIPIYHESVGIYDDRFDRSAAIFTRKHGAHLAKALPYPHSLTFVLVRTKHEALEIMTPRYLGESE